MKGTRGGLRDLLGALGVAALVACSSPAGKPDAGGGAGATGSAGAAGSAGGAVGSAGAPDAAVDHSSSATDARTDTPAALGDAPIESLADVPSGGDAAGPAMTATQFCKGYQDIVTTVLARCPDAAISSVRGLLAGPLLCARFVASIDAGRMRFDGALAASCLQRLQTSMSQGACPARQVYPSPDLSSCGPIVTPLVAAGGTCHDIYQFNLSVECQGDAYCQRPLDQTTCAGVCAARVPVDGYCSVDQDLRCVRTATCDRTRNVCVALLAPGALGDDCYLPGSRCMSGLHCSVTCQGPTENGAACANSTDCVPTSDCRSSSSGFKCTPIKALGATCDPGAQECATGHFCDATSHCSYKLQALGDPCLPNSLEGLRCGPDAYCDLSLVAGVCRAKKQPGEACTGTELTGDCDGNAGRCDQTTHTCVACPL